MRSTASNNAGGNAAAVAAPAAGSAGARLLLGTTYATIVSGALLLAIAEHTGAYLLLAVVLCAAHALVIGPSSSVHVSDSMGKLLALGALGFGLLQARVSKVDISYGLAHFLLLVQLITLYGPRRSRDLRLIQVAMLFQTMVAGIWALDLIYLPVFMLAGLCLMANLTVMALLPPSFFTDEAAATTLAAGTGWRGLLRGIWTPALIVLAGTALLFVVLPRSRNRLRGATFIPEQVTGFSENVSLQEVGRLRQSDAIAMRVRFTAEDIVDGPAIKPRRILMRGLSLPFYEEGQWFSYGSPRTLAAEESRYRVPRSRLDFTGFGTYLLTNVSAEKRLIRQRVYLEANTSDRLFALYRPYSLVGSNRFGHVIQPVSHHLRIARDMEAGESYEVVSMVPEFTGDQLRAAGTPDGSRRRPYFWYIPEDIRPAIEETAREIERIYQDADTDYDRVLAVQSYLLDQERFQYTYALPEFGTLDPIAAFLRTTRVGSCEQFSTAMALLLRAWRIPTRLAIGYKDGEPDPENGTYIFRDKHAHAWVEVYFTGLGWVEFDPTPGAETVEEGPVGLFTRLRRVAEGVKGAIVSSYRATRAFWGGRVLGYSRNQQERLLQGLSRAAGSLAQQASGIFRGIWPGMPDVGVLEVALLVVGLTFTGLGLYLLARWLQTHLAWVRPGPDHDKTIGFYREFLRILRRKGVSRPPQMTPREFVFLASAALATSNEDGRELAAALRAVTDLYYRVRFGQHVASPQEIAAVRDALRSLSRAARARSEPRDRALPEPSA
jgi:transglutaminase-like putative cysteine protease